MGSFLRGATGTGNNFTAQGANVVGQNFQPLLSGSQGQFNQAFNNQGSLAQMLQQQASGQGPNPAQLQFQQNTNNAIKQNAGMIASQKGINPELAQREAAQNAANQSQAAAGQGAQMQAGQQLGAEQALGGVYGAQAGEANNMQSTLQQALSSYNNANVGMQSNLNNVNGAAAGQNASTAGGLFGGLASGVSGAVGGLFAKGGIVPDTMSKQPLNIAPTQNFDAGGMANWGYTPLGSAPSMASSYINGGANSLSNGLSSAINNPGIINGIKSLFASPAKPASGPGSQEDIDSGGLLTSGAQQDENAQSGMILNPQVATTDQLLASPGQSTQLNDTSDATYAAMGGEIPDHLHAMAKIYHPDFQAKMKPKNFTGGGNVPGKAPFKGDNIKNDIVDAKLTPGEVVIDKETLEDKGPIGHAARMVAQAIADRNKKGSDNPMSDFHEALKGAIKNRRAK